MLVDCPPAQAHPHGGKQDGTPDLGDDPPDVWNAMRSTGSSTAHDLTHTGRNLSCSLAATARSGSLYRQEFSPTWSLSPLAAAEHCRARSHSDGRMWQSGLPDQPRASSCDLLVRDLPKTVGLMPARRFQQIRNAGCSPPLGRLDPAPLGTMLGGGSWVDSDE